MNPKDFVHLHVHTQYSLLQGAIFVDRLVNKVKDFGMKAVAITDHANLFGAVEFYEKAKKEGIKPILGCEVYYLPEGSCKVKDSKFKEHHLAHLLLLAQNAQGYLNLCQLLSTAYLEGFYYKPRLDKDFLLKHSEGVIALSCCSKGEIPRRIIEGNPSGALKAAQELSQIYPGRFYLELQDHGLTHEKLLIESLLDISKKQNLPLVATNNAHYLLREDREAHESLLCIQSGRLLVDEDRVSYEGDEFYLKSPEEMVALFHEYPEALQNTTQIANSCEFDFDFKTYYFPKYSAPESKKLEDYLKECVYAGFEERWPEIALFWGEKADQQRPRYLERLEEELKTIIPMGFASYFLVVADFINYAKSKNIPVGPGRGSAAGSLVAYSLKITDLDPIPYHLLFERFLNPERISMPDMDIDFCMNRRDEVIDYVSQKYGNVSQIITFGKMKAKAVIRDVGRVLDMPYGEVDKIAKLIPNSLNITLEEALKVEPRLKELENSSAQIRKLLKIARALEGLNRHASTHAAGVVISDRPLSNFMPLYRGSEEEVVSQFDMKSVEKIGLVKFDFLGLKTLTVIDNALKIIKRTRDIELNINRIPLNDPAVYKIFCQGDGLGIFQLESSGMRDLLVKLKPNCFEDIVALVALYRPGPLGSGMVDDFINRKHGKTSISYELPQLEPILKDTYGVIVYQEQVMQIASALAGFSLGDADLLRRAMGKKKPEEMAKQREKFLMGAQSNKIPQKKAEKIFDLMAKFAEYGFNKSHSAAYALVSYQTAYLKAHYTAEYMASLLTHEMGDTDKILQYISDLDNHDVSVLPPDVNESYRYFSVLTDKEIRFGLAAVKNVGEAAIEAIIEARKKVGKFESYFHFCEEIDTRRINRKVLEFLIKCGAFDNLGIRRSQAFELMDATLEHGNRRQRDRERGQNGLFDQLSSGPIRPLLPDIPEWPDAQKLKFEKEAIGFYITGHPLKGYETQIQKITSFHTGNLKTATDKAEVTMVGMVSALKEIKTKKGDLMAFVTLEDLQGSIEMVVFSDLYRQSQPLLKSEEPLCVKGQVDLGEESAKLLATQIVPLKSMRQIRSQAVRIQVSSEELNENKLKDFRLLLSRYPGNSPVYLHLTGFGLEETVLKLPRELEAEWNSELESELTALLSGVKIIQGVNAP